MLLRSFLILDHILCVGCHCDSQQILSNAWSNNDPAVAITQYGSTVYIGIAMVYQH